MNSTEKFAVQSLELGKSTVQVFGIEDDSQFLPTVSKGLQTHEAIFSNYLTDKYEMEAGIGWSLAGNIRMRSIALSWAIQSIILPVLLSLFLLMIFGRCSIVTKSISPAT